MQVYLDHNASTPISVSVRDTILSQMGPEFGNPSSSHALGERTRTRMAQAREAVASLLGTSPEHILFTSSGTEANNLALSICRDKCSPSHLITTQIEHSSVLQYATFLESQGVLATYVPPEPSGIVSVSEIEKSISPHTTMISMQWINNETGCIQPVEEVAQLCQDKGVLFHCDGAQALGKVPLQLEEYSIDFMTLSGHKIHAPSGIGALYARNPKNISPMLRGGSQEFGLRAGTENIVGIVGLGKASTDRERQQKEVVQRLGSLRDRFEQRLFEALPFVTVNGDPEHRACNTTNLCFTGLDGQALVARLSQDGVYCSQSSACTNQRPEPSYVLRAMGLSEDDAYASVRFSFGEMNTENELDYAVQTIIQHCKVLQQFSF